MKSVRLECLPHSKGSEHLTLTQHSTLSGGLWPSAHTTAYHCGEGCECDGEKMVASDKNNESNLSLMIGYFLSHLII